MKISLIGMSNIGKSHLAARLEAESGFTRIDCDRLIQKRLVAQISALESVTPVGLAEWLGQPYSEGYTEKSNLLLETESFVMDQIFEQLENTASTDRIVVDTSGSVIYLDEKVTSRMRSLTTIYYLDISPLSFEILLKKYRDQPKPVIWGDAFTQRHNEEGMDAISRCYPDLLEFRAREYQKLAHVTLAFERHSANYADPVSLLIKP